ncbi:oligopeptide:H+ symporter [Novosphingobium sp.]|jgi:POT family proton-dependent oligopeptide transporter|uniref:peptide MFS transporter n=1 Tax=Novosphingobium sp. TaxID=1874826 RepID=UPI0022CBAD40|nr:oligopeptide:H+ symporter [Novosphingobium sp.]MCZ8017675.1 oligopeptide:H+ symporter [Novosphingobium sp.]MCZ8033801.1 oligopeptide:H+ symporter [Novosphingobium sp.]MCZ8051157.1 oligopeptide:H+ symporter [Novosphingobium sp.]MCZ8059503.1 oligopeptide:H+ symporter [Novosphingobium sp.]MCZ8231341.1 oligopeptide:H+ symporter [Novosphingobium sp.]
MTVSEATPELELPAHDRAFLGHPKGLGYLAFVEGCERFSYYSMQTLLVLYMVKYLLLPENITGVIGLQWLQAIAYDGKEGQPLASAIFGDYSSLVYLTPIAGGLIADRWLGRRATLLAGAVVMAIGHFLMAFEGLFLFALLALVVGVGLFKGNIASQVGELYGPKDLRRAMAFQIFYIAINVSVIIAPLISGTLGEKVGWHYGFGTAGVVMVAGLLLYIKAGPWLPKEDRAADARASADGIDGKRLLGFTAAALLALFALGKVVPDFAAIGISGEVGLAVALGLLAAVAAADRPRVFALLMLIPVLALAMLTNQQIFNAYLVWADEHFQLTFFGTTLPTSYMITIDAALSFSMLAAVALYWKWRSDKGGREPDEIGKMIIGSFFVIGGGLCLYLAAITQGTGKIGLFWPVMFHLLNSIGFAHIMPVSLALFTKVAPKAIVATVVGIYYLTFFTANKTVGIIGGWYSTMDTPTFWLVHVGTAVAGLIGFIGFKMVIGQRLNDA